MNSHKALSIIIPAFNEQAYISGCLDSIIKHIDDRINYEIIVIDNGSTDATAAIALNKKHTTVYELDRTTISKARNMGARIAEAQFLAFIDADILITKMWADEIVKIVMGNSSKTPYFGGKPYSIRENSSLIERAWFEPLSNLQTKYLSGGNIVIEKFLFSDLGEFDESQATGEDYEFCDRAKSQNIQFDINTYLKVIHLGFPDSIVKFFKREYWHGSSDFSNLRNFSRSKTAMLAVAFILGICGVFISIALGNAQMTTIMIYLELIIILIFTLRKFRLQHFQYFPLQLFLSALYLLARSLSWHHALCKSKPVKSMQKRGFQARN